MTPLIDSAGAIFARVAVWAIVALFCWIAFWLAVAGVVLVAQRAWRLCVRFDAWVCEVQP